MGGNPSPDKILSIGLGFWGSKTFLSAGEIRLFTLLAEGPLDGIRLFKFWNSLTEALQTGQAQNQAKTEGNLFVSHRKVLRIDNIYY